MMTHWIVGFTRMYHGQEYLCVGYRNYFSQRQGRDITIAIIESQCADCGATFQCTHADTEKLQLRRRCDNCKAKGETSDDWCLVDAGAQQQKPRTMILDLACGFSEFCVFPAGFSGYSLELTQQ